MSYLAELELEELGDALGDVDAGANAADAHVGWIRIDGHAALAAQTETKRQVPSGQIKAQE